MMFSFSTVVLRGLFGSNIYVLACNKRYSCQICLAEDQKEDGCAWALPVHLLLDWCGELQGYSLFQAHLACSHLISRFRSHVVSILVVE